MATEPVVLRIVRPYGSVEEYLAAEAWSVDARAMLLIEHPPLPADTAIVFEVTLKDGSRPIKAEARVAGAVEAKDGRPAGLRVRFRRYGASTKAFIERAMRYATTGDDVGAALAPVGSAEPSDAGASSPEASNPVELAPEASAPLHVPPDVPATLHVAPELASLDTPPAPPETAVHLAGPHVPAGETAHLHAPHAAGSTAPSVPPRTTTPSGHPTTASALAALRARGDRAPETPANREYLLEKLRQRNAPDDVTMRYQRD